MSRRAERGGRTLSNHKEYTCWNNLISSKYASNFVPESWKDKKTGFLNFLEDVGNAPDVDNVCINKIDSSKPHGKGNSVWDVLFSINGKVMTCGYRKHKEMDAIKSSEYRACASMLALARRNGDSICERWSCKHYGLMNFLEDMGKRPPGKYLAKIDWDGPLAPDNMAWRSRSDIVKEAHARRNGGA